MITSFYVGALQAICLMGKTVGDDISRYEELMNKSKAYLESKLLMESILFRTFNGLDWTLQTQLMPNRL